MERAVPSKRKTIKLAPPSAAATLHFDQSKEVRAIARERVGAVKPRRIIRPKDRRKKPKQKQELGIDADT